MGSRLAKDGRSRRNKEGARKARRYVLGDISESERDEFEVNVLADTHLAAVLEDVEFDLCEAYLQRRLTETEREQFECFFLRSDVHQAMLASMAALHAKSLFMERYALVAVLANFATGAWAFLQRIWLICTVSALVVIGVAILWWNPLKFWRAAPADKKSGYPTSEMVESRPQTDRDATAHNTNVAANSLLPGQRDRAGRQAQTGNTLVRGIRSAAVALVLDIGTPRAPGGSPTAPLTARTRGVALTIRLGEVEFDKYQVMVARADGVSISAPLPTLNSENRTLSIFLRRDLLRQGDYTVKIVGKRHDGNEERVGTTSFRVIE